MRTATVYGSLLLGATALAIAFVVILAWRDGETSISNRPPSELVAEKAEARSRAAEPADQSMIKRFGDVLPGAGAEWPAGVLLGFVALVAAAGYLVLLVRGIGRASEVSGAAAAICSIAAVDAVLIAISGMFLAYLAYVGIGD